MTSLDLTWAVRSVDSLLRQRQGIQEITDDKDCIIRIAIAASHRAVSLSDGAAIAVGDPVVRIHYWNEHLPMMPRDGPNAAWASLLLSRLRYSLGILARRMECDPQLAAVRAIHASPAFASRFGGPIQLSRICERFGYDVFASDQDGGLLERLHGFLDSLLVWGLIWAFNPGSLKNHGFSHGRIEIWMSRGKLVSRYGGSPARQPADRETLVKDAEPI